MRSFLKEAFTRPPELLHLGKKNQPKLWSSKRYFAAESRAIDSAEQILVANQLRADLKSFFDEYAALKARVSYQYGPTGMRNGYSESMSEIAINFRDQMAAHSRPTARAELEVAVAQAAEVWMANPHLKVGEKLIVTSPRGLPIEGYPGLDEKNYAFINIFEKTENGFVFHQFRNYEKNQDLPNLQANLVGIHGQQMSAKKIADLETEDGRFSDRVDLDVIDTIISLPSSVEMEAVTTILFAGKEKWPIDIDQDLPQLDANQYEQQLEQVIAFCMQQFAEIFQDTTVGKVGQFDLLIDLTRQTFLKWVEDHALNYEHNTAAQYQLDLVQLNAAWRAQLREASGQQLSEEDSQQLASFSKQTALNPGLPLNQAASWAHCITGTPFSVINNPSLMQAMKMNNLSINQLAEIVGKDRAQLWEQGVCQSCGQHTLVGECSICLNCELELGNQDSSNLSLRLQEETLDKFSGADRAKANKLMGIIATALLRSSINPWQMIVGDVLDPESSTNEWQKIAVIVQASPSPLKELEIIAQQLVEKDEIPANLTGEAFVFQQKLIERIFSRLNFLTN